MLSLAFLQMTRDLILCQKISKKSATSLPQFVQCTIYEVCWKPSSQLSLQHEV